MYQQQHVTPQSIQQLCWSVSTLTADRAPRQSRDQANRLARPIDWQLAVTKPQDKNIMSTSAMHGGH